MKRRFFIGSDRAFELAVAEVLTMFKSLGRPVELTVEPFVKRLSDPQRSILHCMLRDLAGHCGVSEEQFKDWVKAGEFAVAWPLEDVPPPAGLGVERVKPTPKHTMRLSRDEVRALIDQLGALGAEHGVEFSAPVTWHDDEGRAA